MDEVNCMNCCVGAFKHELCSDKFCNKYASIGNSDDFVKKIEVMQNDLISRQDAIEAVKEAVIACEQKYAVDALNKLPTVQAKTTQILAEQLNGCPLFAPCDLLFEPDGWCKEHCKTDYPDTECWLKYAEVMVNK